MIESKLKSLPILVTAIYACVSCSDGSSTPTSTASGSSDDVVDVSGNNDDTSADISVSSQLLAQFSKQIHETYTAFLEATTLLESKLKSYQTSLSSEDKVAAQQAWVAAVDLWQHAEAMLVGPAGVMGEVVGGEDVRDEVYSWPLVNNCRVDQETVEGSYSALDTFKEEAVNVRGLDAIEYLLYTEDEGNGCKATASINSKNKWEAIQAEVTQRRADYAVAAASLIRAEAEGLVAAWKDGASNFAKDFNTAGDGSDKFETEQAALNALSDALFYIDKMTKDMKLSEPLGLSECDTDVCLDALESKWARRSKEHILNNLKAAQIIYLGASPGTEAVGFDDLLNSVDAKELASEMSIVLAEAIKAVESIEGNLYDALTTEPAEVEKAYKATKAFTDLLKTQFVAVLNLEVPQRAASDND